MLKIATKFDPQKPHFQLALEAGFRHAEFWLNETRLLEYEQIITDARQFELEYVPHFSNKRVSDEALAAAVRLYKDLNCKAMVIHKPMYEAHAEALLKLEPSLRLGVENHRLSPTAFNKWAKQHDWLTLDVEHVWKFTLKDAPLEQLVAFVEKFLRKHHQKLVHVHLPGYIPGEEEHRPMYCSRRMVFELFHLLSKFDYNGFIVSETLLEYQNPMELRMDTLLYERWLVEKQQIDAVPLSNVG